MNSVCLKPRKGARPVESQKKSHENHFVFCRSIPTSRNLFDQLKSKFFNWTSAHLISER